METASHTNDSIRRILLEDGLHTEYKSCHCAFAISAYEQHLALPHRLQQAQRLHNRVKDDTGCLALEHRQL